MTEKIEGTIAHVSPNKDFGFIQCRDPKTNLVQKYYFHVARIILCEVDPREITVGYFVRFLISDVPPKRPNDSPYAIDIEVYIQKPVDPVESQAEVQS